MTKIQLKRSSALLSGSARVPAANQLDYGELAINYSSTDPQLFYKDSGGNVVSFFEPYAPLSGATFTGDCTFNTDVDFDGAVTIQGDSTNGSGKLTLTCEQNTHAVNIKAPANSASANYTLTLPSSTGSSGEVLSTDGSGGLSWAYAAMSTADKSKLDGIAAGAEVNVNADWNATSGDAEILNKPTNVSSFTNDAGYISSADGGNAGTLDGIDSSSFLRSDTNDSFTGGALTISTAITGGSVITASSAVLQVNGFQRTGTIYLHEGNSPSGTTALQLANSSGTLYWDSNQVWHAGNDGSGSGLDADTLDGIQASGFVQTPSSSSQFISSNASGAINPNNTTINGLYYANSVSLFGQSDGALFSQAYSSNWQGQIFQDYRTGQLAIRGKNNGTWQSWRTVWDSSNDGAGSGLDADNLDGFGWDTAGKNIRGSAVYADDWFRNNVQGQGIYNQVTNTHFYAAGSNYWHINSSNGLVCYTAYNSSAGNSSNRKGYLYWDGAGFGLLNSNGSWAAMTPHGSGNGNIFIVGGHTNNNHYNSVSNARMSFGGGNDFSNYHFGVEQENYGGSYTKLDLRWHTGIRMGAQRNYGGIRLYDSEDLGSLQWHFNGSSGYTYKNVWLNTNGTTGMFSATNGAHIMPNTTSTYAQWRVSGSKNSWSGIMIDTGYYTAVMFDSSGNGGFYQENGAGWTLYYHRTNTCMGISGSTTSSSYGCYVTGALYATGNITAYSDARRKTNIKTVKSALSKVLNLRGVTYNKINVDKTVNDKTELGLIAQEVEKVVPEVVTYAEDVDQYGVSYGNLTALLIEAVKELKIELNELKESLA